jgi:hypothetical protein
MNYFLIAVLAILMILVVVSLVRGIAAFMQGTKADLESEGTGATENQILQNRMMFNRIKYQAAAVLVVGVLLAMTR